MRRTYPARGRGMICRMDETARENALALDDADPLAGFAAEAVNGIQSQQVILMR